MNERLRNRPPPRTTRAAEGLPRWRWTTADLLRLVELGVLDEKEPIELLGGEIVPMPPSGLRHDVVADELTAYWRYKVPADVWVGIERQFNLDEAPTPNPISWSGPLPSNPTTSKAPTLCS